MNHPLYITSPDSMATLLAELKSSKIIAVDTEFQREHTYYPQLALVQLASENVTACIDPLAFDARDALAGLMRDTAISKLFHSCSQDLEVLYCYLGEVPVSVLDTQIAYAMLHDDHQVSYAAMVNHYLDIELEKSQTRTDWLRRPLTDKQLDYAADDVIYLYRLYNGIEQALKDAGRYNWFTQDCAQLTFDPLATDDSQLWRRVKGSNKLRRQQLATVQAIAEWREKTARERDRTRRRILADDLVIKLALQPPRDHHQLDRQLSSRAASFQRDELDALQQCIEDSLASTPDNWPENRFAALDAEQKQQLKAMQEILAETAESLGISSAMLYSRKVLEKMLRSENPDTCIDSQNWRYRVAGEQIVQFMAQNTNTDID